MYNLPSSIFFVILPFFVFFFREFQIFFEFFSVFVRSLYEFYCKFFFAEKNHNFAGFSMRDIK